MYEVRQCTHPDCRLRMPIDPAVHSGAYCPLCGLPMTRAAASFQHHGPENRCIHPKRQISVLLDNIRSAHNTGAIFRTADGVGARHLYLCGITPNPAKHPALQKTALGAEHTLPWSAHLNALDMAKELHIRGYCILALETTPESQPLFSVDLSICSAQPLVLVVGNEQAGVDPGLLEIADLVLSVPMSGLKTSLNVAVTFGIAVYWLAFS